MATYRYVAMGAAKAGTIEAGDRASALRSLTARGETPTTLEEVAEKRASGSLLLKRAMSRGELGSFMNELATAVNAGLPLVPALRTIRDAGRADAQRQMIDGIIGSVEEGDALGEAVKDAGKPFDELTVALVSSGERAGRLGEVLNQCATLLDRETKLKRALLGALIYPLIILLLVVGAMIVVVTVIVPRVLQSVEGQLEVLPLPTRVVQGIAEFFGGYWWAVLVGIALVAWAWTQIYRQPQARMNIDRTTLKIPVIGPLVRDVAVARFTRTLGTLVGAGIPVLQALSITRATLGNKALEEAVAAVGDKVSEGRTIAEPMAKSGHFPPLLVQLVAMGERTGRLDELLLSAATAFEEKTEQGIELLTKVLPPMLIIVLACMVAGIILAILLPLLEMQNAISGG